MKLCRWIWFIGHDLFKETNELRRSLNQKETSYFGLDGRCKCFSKINHFPWDWLHTTGELQKTLAIQEN